MLELLQHRPLVPRRVVVGGQQEHRQAVDVAVAAPVIMLVAPGPIEAVQASVDSRRVALAKPIAVWTIDCSLHGW